MGIFEFPFDGSLRVTAKSRELAEEAVIRWASTVVEPYGNPKQVEHQTGIHDIIVTIDSPPEDMHSKPHEHDALGQDDVIRSDTGS